jgi:hypothetical protein
VPDFRQPPDVPATPTSESPRFPADPVSSHSFSKRPIPANAIPIARVPRSFNTGRMLIIVTLYAFLFSLLQVTDAHPALYPYAGIFVAAIVLAQMFGFAGKDPRLASFLVGTITMPILTLVVMLALLFSTGGPRGGAYIQGLFCTLFASALVGGFFGYLVGTVCAGAFLIVDRRWDAGQPLPEQPILADIVSDEEQEAAQIESTSPHDPWWQANDA